MKERRSYIRLYATAIMISIISSCGTVVKTTVPHCSLYATKTDTIITVKQNLLDLFIQRYIPDYSQDDKSRNYAESEYGISARDAFEHYSRTHIKERDIKTGNMFRLQDNGPNKLSSYQITKTDSCANNGTGIDSLNLNEIESRAGRVCPFPADSLSEHIFTYRISFRKGCSHIDIMNGNNMNDLKRISTDINDMGTDMTMVLDSIYISASASPEGLCQNNYKLAEKRHEAVLALLDLIFDCHQPASETESNATTKSGNNPRETRHEQITSDIIGENWNTLEELISADNNISVTQELDFIEICEIENPDERERVLSSRPYYKYISDIIYPKLRASEIKIFYHTENRK